MTTVETEKAELAQQMEEAERQKDWERLVVLAECGQRLDPKWFEAAARKQAGWMELAGLRYPNDPVVQAALAANQRVRELADELGL